jgi:holo-[acyl-carrier protein] synthase
MRKTACMQTHPSGETAPRLMSRLNSADSDLMPSRVGIDLIAVESVEESIRTHDERYLNRVYTQRELADCRTSAGIDAERLAARFAAKEATMKILRPGAVAVPWNSIGVRRDPGCAPELELTGSAATLAGDVGISDFAVSLTHDGGFAAAVVVARIGDRRG